MSATPTVYLGPVPRLRAALAAALRSPSGGQHDAKTHGLLGELAALAQQECGLALRMAMVLASIKQLDVAELGYSGFLAFCKQQVDWSPSWVRALVRLIESPLDEVKAAAAAGALPLRVAVQAPGKVAVAHQAAWLAQPVRDEVEPPRGATFHGQQATVIRQARELARACMGCTDASLTQVDAFILRHWHAHDPGSALVEGRTAPPLPEPRSLDFAWATSGALGAPAQALLGPFSTPATLAQALAQLAAVQAVRKGRVLALAHAFAMVHHHGLWLDAGFDSPWDFAQQVLGWSRRTAQRYRKLGWGIEWHPRLEQAVHGGLCAEAACQIGWWCDTEWQCTRWLRVARHLGQQELLRACAPGGHDLCDYERALAIARRCAAGLLGPSGPTAQPSGVSAVFRIGQPEQAPATRAGTTQRGRVASPAGTAGVEPAGVGGGAHARSHAPGAGTLALRIALPFASESGRGGRVRGHPHLADAARWFLAHNQPRPLSGFASAKDRAGYRCQNPECGRSTLRAASHHVHWRRFGGTDDAENAVVLCPPCHLRGVHTSEQRLRVARVVVEGHEALLWEYPGRWPILQFRQVPRER